MKIVPLHPPPPPLRSVRARRVARWFGLPDPSPQAPMPQMLLDSLIPQPGRILLLGGPSGSGKSTLLRAIRTADADWRRWIDVNAIDPPDLPLVDCFGDAPVVDVLRLLARVGLCEVWTALRLPGELSDGQRFRLRLAMALHRCESVENAVLVCDEFAATLDRVTANVVARCLRRCITPPRAAILATSHDDLTRALRADVTVRCDFATASVVASQMDSPDSSGLTSTARSG